MGGSRLRQAVQQDGLLVVLVQQGRNSDPRRGRLEFFESLNLSIVAIYVIASQIVIFIRDKVNRSMVFETFNTLHFTYVFLNGPFPASLSLF